MFGWTRWAAPVPSPPPQLQPRQAQGTRAGRGPGGLSEQTWFGLSRTCRALSCCLPLCREGEPPTCPQSPNLAHPTAKMLLPCVVSPVPLRRGAQPHEVRPCPSLNWDLPSSDGMLPAGPGRWWHQGRPQVQTLQRAEAGRCNTSSGLGGASRSAAVTSWITWSSDRTCRGADPCVDACLTQSWWVW